MNYIITGRKFYFEAIGNYNYCTLEQMILPNKLAVDTESTSLKTYKGELFSIQIGTGLDNYLIDLATIDIQKVFELLKGKVLVFHNACLPSDTEVLTTEGWKNIINISTSDTVFGWNSGLIQPQKVLSTITDNQEVFCLKNSGRNLRSTKNHRWLVNTRGKISYKTLENFDFKYDKVILNGKYIQEIDFPITDDELRIFTWAITDGHIAKTETKSMFSQIVITQSQENSLFIAEIETSLKNTVNSYTKSIIKMPGYEDCIRFFIKATDTRKLLDKIDYKDNFNFCQWVLKLSNRQIDLFIDIFNKAEGSKNRLYSIGQSKTVNPTKRDAIALALYLKGFTVSFSTDTVNSKKSVIADTRTLKKSTEGFQDVYCLMTELSNFIIRQKECIMLTGNCFDLGWFYKYGFFPWKVRDTFLSSKILHNGLFTIRHGFGFVMERELGLIYDKSEQKNIAKIQLSTDKAIQYCFNDVDKLLDLDDALNKKIIEGGYLNAYQLHRRYIRALAYMEQCGVPISLEKWNNKIKKDKEELKEKEKVVINYIFNHLPQYRERQLDLFSTNSDIVVSISSPTQMIPVFKALGINVIDAEGKESTSEDTIKKTKHPFVPIWLEYKSIAHDVSTFGENFKPHIHEGRLYTSYNPIMDTARISAGGKDAEGNKQVNTLNLPANEKTRECVVPNIGFDYIVADYSGQETVTGADITGDAAMISSIVNKSCLHCAFARVLFPELALLSDQEIIDNHKSKRQAAKAPRFCFQFGGGAFTLAQNEGISIEEANKIEQGYKQLHEGIYEYGNKKFKEAIELGYIESTFGFKLHLTNFDSFKKKHEWFSTLDRSFWTKYREGKLEYKAEKKAEEDKKKYSVKNKKSYDLYRKHSYDVSQYFKSKSEYFKLCLNNPTQTKAAFQTKAATNKIFEYIWKKKHFWDARISLVLHDEIGMEVKKDLSTEYAKIIEDSMINEGNKFLTNPILFMDTEAVIGNSWYECK